MEFIRDGCVDSTGKLCKYCEVNRWVGDKMTRIPQPVSDSQRPNHYLSVFDTSTLNEHGPENLMIGSQEHKSKNSFKKLK